MNKTYLLNEICNIITSPVDKKSHDNEIHVKLCNYKDVYYNDFISDNINFMLATAKQSEIDRYKLYKNDVIITKDSESYDDIGISTYVIEDIPLLLCGYHLTILRPKSDYVDGLFLAYYLKLKSVLNCFSKYANGIIRYSLTQETYNKITIILPPLEEQKKIADILLTWDKAITTLKEIIQQKELQKKGLMQNLLTGKKRLNGFNDEWKEVKLGEILDSAILCKKGNIITEKNIISGNIPVVAGGRTIPYYHNQYNYDGITITISSSGYAGFVWLHNYPIWASDCLVLKGINNLYDTSFLYYYLKLKQEQIFLLKTGGAQPHVYIKDIARILIPNITYEEQTKIAEILMKADEEISLLNKQLELYTEQKKGLMQQLLTGKIRVN